MAGSKRLVLGLLLVTAGCHDDSTADGTSETEATTGTETETGEPVCPEQVWTGSTLSVTTAEEATALPLYTRIEGTLHVEGIPGVQDLSFLSCLREVEGSMAINGVDLESLAGLEGLEQVVMSSSGNDGRLSLWENPKLTKVDGLESLHHVDVLSVYRNPALTSLEGLAALESAGLLNIYDNDALTVLGMRAMRSAGTISVGPISCEGVLPGDPLPEPAGNAGLEEVDGLDSLEQFNELIFAGNSSLSSISGLTALSTATGPRLILVLDNPSLPYAHILDVESQLGYSLPWVCGNLDDPEPCQCP